MRDIIYTLALVMMAALVACDGEEPEPEVNTRPQTVAEYNQVSEGLKDYYDANDYFAIGAAIEPASLDNPGEVALLKRHFSSITAENVMKWSTLQPSEGVFNFGPADRLVDFARANGMVVFGHTLCWHNQVPDWVFKDNGATASRELVMQRLRDHITTVMTHFRGKVYGWDVVNEAIDDGSATYKNTIWYQICGADYIFEAFETARAADPAAKLFYNDYSATNTTKREKIYGLLAALKAQGLVDGMGLQGHWNINGPSDNQITAALNRYKEAGVELRISELDVSIYPSNSDPESEYTPDISLQQAIAYGRFFRVFRTFKDDMSGITMWGLADNHTWLDNFPVPGRKNYPMLFDVNLVPKQAYFTVINF
ncbi:MAG: endo-1,4-beta-xylanase [Bacteroidales bacterium]|nr:endo-1,4-beta-xylanase [Bacteroidales bacterium]MDT8374999.1 endo-1,4-beta-xylanase [Bacteroidales bacterium]